MSSDLVLHAPQKTARSGGPRLGCGHFTYLDEVMYDAVADSITDYKTAQYAA
jgi:hypothetical protein